MPTRNSLVLISFGDSNDHGDASPARKRFEGFSRAAEDKPKSTSEGTLIRCRVPVIPPGHPFGGNSPSQRVTFPASSQKSPSNGPVLHNFPSLTLILPSLLALSQCNAPTVSPGNAPTPSATQTVPGTPAPPSENR